MFPFGAKQPPSVALNVAPPVRFEVVTVTPLEFAAAKLLK